MYPFCLQSEHGESGYETDDDASVGFNGSDVHVQVDAEVGAVDQIIILIQPAEVRFPRSDHHSI